MDIKDCTVKYSFVLPAYKATYLKEAINSILCQTYTDFELIVVNDSSPEDIGSIIGLYQDQRIRYYINEKNLGGTDLVAQWNHSISYAQGKYLILASDDDIYDREFLERMDQMICRYPEVNVFRPRVKIIDKCGEIIGVEGYIKEYSSGIEFLHAWTKGWIGSGIPFYVFKRGPLLAIGGFAQYPLAWFSDDATVLRLSKNGIVSSNDVLFSFRSSGINISSKRNSRSSLGLKLLATNLFYQELLRHIDKLKAEDDIERYMIVSVKSRLSSFIYSNKAMGQIECARWIDVTRSLPVITKCRLIPLRSFIRWYIRFSLKSLVR